jgi:hypothetical protein
MNDTKQLTDDQIARIIDEATAVLGSLQQDADRLPDVRSDQLVEVHRDTFTWDTLLALATEVRDLRASTKKHRDLVETYWMLRHGIVELGDALKQSLPQTPEEEDV